MRSSSSSPHRSGISRAVSPTSNAVSSTTRPNLSRSTARFASWKEQAGARRSSSSPRRSSISSATESRPTRSQSSVPPSTARVRRSKRHSARSASRSRSRAGQGSGRPRSARRSSRSFASPGETAPAASSTPSCGRRMPASHARMSTSSRAGSEGAPCSGATARWRRRRSSATAAPFPCWISLHPRSSRCAPLGPSLWRCFATPTALVRRLRPRRRSATSGRQRRSRGCSTSWSASRAAACRSPPTMSSLLSIARPCAATLRANRAALRFSIWDVPARGASRPCS